MSDVEEACACPETGTYDIFRHIRLRQSFTTVFVAADGQVVDQHRNFVEGGGHSEHALFISNLKEGRDQPPAKGPKSSQPCKAHPKGNPKRSEHLKAMLKPPSSQEGRSGEGKPGVHPPLPLMDKPNPDSALPGAPPPAQLPVLHCSHHGDQCLARTGKGTRCRKARVQGSFCTVHSAQASQQAHVKSLYGSMRDAAGDAMTKWEKSMVELAKQTSLQDVQRDQERAALRLAVVEPRLRSCGYTRAETAADGNCQLTAIVQTAGLPMEPFAFRQAVVSYLRPLGDFFAGLMEGKFHGNYEGYLNFMSMDGSWGDHLTLVAASHLLMTPLRVVTDSASPDPAAYIVEVTPPDIIAEDAWGAPIYLVNYMDKHFESTHPIDAGTLVGATPSSVKSEGSEM